MRFILALGFLFTSPLTYAASAPEVTVVRNMGIAAFRIQRMNNDNEKFRAYCSLFREAVDVETVTDEIVSRYKNRATESQMQELYDVFTDLLVSYFSDLFEETGDGYLNVWDRTSRLGRDVGVRADLFENASNRITYRFVFQMRRNGNLIQMVDAKVGNLALTRFFSDKYRDILSRNSSDPIGALLNELRGEYPTCP